MPDANDIAWLLRLARSLSADAADGEDLAQDVLLAATVRGSNTTRGVLAAIARNRQKMRIRSDRRRYRREAAAAGPEYTPGFELAANVRVALERLDPNTRTLVTQHYLEGRSSVELATLYGGNASTIRGQIARARQQLRDELDDSWDGRRPWTAVALAAVGPAASHGFPAGIATALWAAPVALGAALGCGWVLHDGPSESPPASSADAAASRPPRARPTSSRVATTRSRPREANAPAPPSEPRAEPMDEASEALEAFVFGPLEDTERTLRACLEATPTEASGKLSVQLSVATGPRGSVLVDDIRIRDDQTHGAPDLEQCVVESVLGSTFPDPDDVALDDYVFELDLDARSLVTTIGVGPGELFRLLAAMPELEGEVVEAANADAEAREDIRAEINADPELAADFPRVTEAAH